MVPKDFVQDSTYASHFGTYRGLLDRVLDHDPSMFDLPREALIVDAGCGYGGLLSLLKTRGYLRLVGVEPDSTCRAGGLAAGLDVREGTLTATGLADSYADVVIVNQVFHHVADYQAACTELARILKPGGLLCYMEPLNTLLRTSMDALTFQTPLRHIIPAVEARYQVMNLEMETGLYPAFLKGQKVFRRSLDEHFDCIWHRRSWFFQFGKYRVKR